MSQYFFRRRMQDYDCFFLSFMNILHLCMLKNGMGCFRFRLGPFMLLRMRIVSLVINSMVQSGFRLNFFVSSNYVMNFNRLLFNLVRNMDLFLCFLRRNVGMRKFIILSWATFLDFRGLNSYCLFFRRRFEDNAYIGFVFTIFLSSRFRRRFKCSIYWLLNNFSFSMRNLVMFRS